MSANDKIPFDRKSSYIVTPTGEAIQDGMSLGKLPEDWHKCDISALVEPGFIHRARIDYLSKFGSKILTALVLTSGLSITFALVGVGLFGGNVGQATPPSFVEKLVTAPITFISGNYPSADALVERPVIDVGQIMWQPKVRLTGEDAASDWATKGADLPGILKMEIEALNKTGKLDPRIATLAMTDIRDTWSTPTVEKEVPAGVDAYGYPTPATKAVEGGKPDTFRVVESGDNVFVFSVVLNDEGRWQPWSGFFRKGKDGWQYHNLSVPGVQSYQVRGFSGFPLNDMPNAVAKAFPQLVRQPAK